MIKNNNQDYIRCVGFVVLYFMQDVAKFIIIDNFKRITAEFLADSILTEVWHNR